MKAGRSDTAARKRAQRHGRERGCRVNITADELEAAGIDPAGPVPWYRVVGIGKGRARFVVQLFDKGP
jgi:hypothetical protein